MVVIKCENVSYNTPPFLLWSPSNLSPCVIHSCVFIPVHKHEKYVLLSVYDYIHIYCDHGNMNIIIYNLKMKNVPLVPIAVKWYTVYTSARLASPQEAKS